MESAALFMPVCSVAVDRGHWAVCRLELAVVAAVVAVHHPGDRPKVLPAGVWECCPVCRERRPASRLARRLGMGRAGRHPQRRKEELLPLAVRLSLARLAALR